MFSSRLQFILDSLEISQTKLGKLLGYTPQAISKWIAGISTPDYETLIKMAQIFGVTVDYLIGNDEIKTENEEKLKQTEAFNSLFAKYGYLSENEYLTTKDIEKIIAFNLANKHFIHNQK